MEEQEPCGHKQLCANLASWKEEVEDLNNFPTFETVKAATVQMYHI
jgi:hypothetical protein